MLAFPIFDGYLFGSQLGGRIGLNETGSLQLVFDASYRFGWRRSSLGQIETHAAALELALLWTGEADVTSSRRGFFFRLGWDVGIRAVLGWAWAQGHPTASAEVDEQGNGPILAPALEGALRLGFARSWRLLFDLLLGYVIVGIDVNVELGSKDGVGERNVEHLGGIGHLLIGVGIGLEVEL